jgi:glycosyltransferase involved in cell wall biosynthesis
VDDEETGFLVPPRDPRALAARIVQLLKDETLRQRMGRAGLARVRRLFTVERMVQETAAAYTKILPPKGGSH